MLTVSLLTFPHTPSTPETPHTTWTLNDTTARSRRACPPSWPDLDETSAAVFRAFGTRCACTGSSCTGGSASRTSTRAGHLPERRSPATTASRSATSPRRCTSRRPPSAGCCARWRQGGLVERRADEADQRLTRVYLFGRGTRARPRRARSAGGSHPGGARGARARGARGARATAGQAEREHRALPRRDDRGRARGDPVIRLLRERLRPYWRQIVVILVLLLVQAIANLYLPTLNADIINNGVITGDTAYILRTGAVMLAVTLVFVLAAIVGVYYGSRVAMGVRPRRARGALPPRRELLAGRGEPLRHPVADHAHDQRRAAGADGRADDAHRRRARRP